MAQDFFEHYWDTVRWKEVAREARAVPYREQGDNSAAYSPTTSTYSGSMSIGEIFLFLVKLVIVFFLIVLCAIGAFVSVRFFWGALWGIAASVVVFVLAWMACRSWLQQ